VRLLFLSGTRSILYPVLTPFTGVTLAANCQRFLLASRVTITLEDALKVAKETPRPFPFPAHPEVEDHHSTRPAVLPQIGLVIFATHAFRLNAHRRFIGLDIVAGQQLLSHCPADGPEQFTDPHHPAIQGSPGQVNAGFPTQNCTLSIQRTVICLLAHHRVDHQPITGQAFVDDAGRQRRTQHSLLWPQDQIRTLFGAVNTSSRISRRLASRRNASL
jgi:hypothetical protein